MSIFRTFWSFDAFIQVSKFHNNLSSVLFLILLFWCFGKNPHFSLHHGQFYSLFLTSNNHSILRFLISFDFQWSGRVKFLSMRTNAFVCFSLCFDNSNLFALYYVVSLFFLFPSHHFFLSLSVSFFLCFFHFFLFSFLFFFLRSCRDFLFRLFVVIGYDQPCDLRLLTPATCLKELSEPVLATKSPPNLLLLKTDLETHAGERTSPRKSTIAASATSAANATSTAASAATTATTTGTGAAVSNATNNNIFMCKQCGNSYARPHSLNRHIRFECGVEPKFECPICRKKSKHKHNLVLHMRTHQHRWFESESAKWPTKKKKRKTKQTYTLKSISISRSTETHKQLEYRQTHPNTIANVCMNFNTNVQLVDWFEITICANEKNNGKCSSLWLNQSKLGLPFWW